MRCARLLLAALWVLLLCAGCGGGSSSVTTYTGGVPGASAGTTVSVDTPIGPNTTEVLVDSGPASFSLGAANIPYVSVTVCAPNSGAVAAGNCVTIDHVFLDTGSYGLRVLKSSVSKLALPAVTLAANPALGAPAGTAVECYPFVLGGVWGPLATADVHMAGETAQAIAIQVIDDSANVTLTAPADCLAAADGSLFSTAASLQANGILGIGMMGYDCGLSCSKGDYAGFHVQYYACPDALTANCKPAAIAAAQQTQNPVVHFVPDDGNPQPDNNGSIIRLPELPLLGAGTAKGRLVFGIGTRPNNQIAPGASMLMADANPASASYLYLTTSMGGSVYPDSYIDSGSNAFFFNDTSISTGCKSSVGSGTASGWYCPPAATPAARNATLTDVLGNMAPVSFSVHNADALFSGSSTAFANLGGSITLAPRSFVWGLSFFFGRSVYTSIWGQALSPNGPWNAF